jgi:hypothetical protein
MTFLPAELDILVHWMTERDKVRAKKALGLPKPWTSDPLLQGYKWCNVKRADDAVSIAMLSRWYRPNGHPEISLVAAVLGRLVNWPDSLMAITGGEPFHISHLPHARGRLADRAAMGLKVFTSAYVVPGVPGLAKVDSVCNLAELVHKNASSILDTTMRGTWANLVRLKGLGSFLAGQMVADLAQIETGRAWPDASTWAPIGPGSARGLNRLMGRPKDKAVSQEEFERLLPELMSILYPLVQPLWDDRRLQAMDVQNCACEYDKNRRLMLGEGRVRARYDGAGGSRQIGLELAP